MFTTKTLYNIPGVTKRYGTKFRMHSSHLEDEIMLYEHGSGNVVIQQHFKACLSFQNGFKHTHARAHTHTHTHRHTHTHTHAHTHTFIHKYT